MQTGEIYISKNEDYMKNFRLILNDRYTRIDKDLNQENFHLDFLTDLLNKGSIQLILITNIFLGEL